MKKLLLLLLTVGSALSAHAQSQILQTYLEEGIAGNLALKQQNLEIEKALKGIDIARTNYFPQVNFSPSYSVAFGGRKIQIPIGDLLNPVYSTLNKLTDSDAFPQVENASEQLAPMNFHDTKLEIKVPLFNTDIRYNVALQKDLLVTEEAKRKFLEYELRHAMEAAYYQYLQSLEAVQIYENSEKLLESYLRLNQTLVQHEEALKDILLSSEYELSKVQQEKAVAEKNTRLAQAYFNFLLNRKLEEPVLADTAFFHSLPPKLSLEEYTETAFRNRPEFEQLNAGLKTTQTLLRMQEKNAVLPQVFMGANTGFQGFGYTFRDQAYMVGQIGLNWPIFHAGEKKIKIQQTRISGEILRTKTEEAKKQVEMQVYRSFHELETALSALGSKERDLARTEKIFQLVNSRYKNGAAIPLEVHKAQNDRLIAQLSHSLGKLEVWLKYAELKKGAGW
ncbi:TolC family protein [Leadbetterella sp. DM7]|uniref:TolC family protein n=1 Tax=Leadbetterella sp. DM7 TaxID=3235085 RepID=UPI00349E8C17